MKVKVVAINRSVEWVHPKSYQGGQALSRLPVLIWQHQTNHSVDIVVC